MKFRLTTLAAILHAVPLAATAQSAPTLGVVTVTAQPELNHSTVEVKEATLAPLRTNTSDTARLLQNTPGVSFYEAGGVSSLPAIHGLADDRLRIQVDGMDLMAACPNHMNSALSYIDPSRVAAIAVYAGITPVSAGGDSIGGTIAVTSAPPLFANSPQEVRTEGDWGAFYRSNGEGQGVHLNASYVGEDISLTYSGAHAKASNYTAGGDFKPAGPGTAGSRWLAANEVGSSAYEAENHNLGIAVRDGQQLLQLDVGIQHLPFEGFANQRMDMTGNDNTLYNLRYSSYLEWGRLQARLYQQDTDHAMNMGPDRYRYGTLGMPMNTNARTNGFSLQADYDLSQRDVIVAGVEALNYRLYDWWPQAGGIMGPRTFWNVDYGTRDRLGAFVEWEAQWDAEWQTLLGLRSEVVTSDAAAVQGYNAQAIWAEDAASFNAQDRRRTDHNVDVTALVRRTPSETQTFEWGFARKTRSPSLYQHYPWSTQAMAALMNNFVGDGNAYVGNPDLKPEVAYTLSASADWHDTDTRGFKVSGYYTWIDNYIDAQRCNFGQCAASNLTAARGFVTLQYANQSAQMYGVDLSGQMPLGTSAQWGTFSASGMFSWVRGSNPTTGDNLYNIMPADLKLALEQRTGPWTHAAEVQLVAPKTLVSQVRNEVPTDGYGLLNWRSSYEMRPFRVDIAIENLLDRFYQSPLGGAYLGQGASMTSTGIPWGVIVPGKGRSINLAFTYRF